MHCPQYHQSDKAYGDPTVFLICCLTIFSWFKSLFEPPNIRTRPLHIRLIVLLYYVIALIMCRPRLGSPPGAVHSDEEQVRSEPEICFSIEEA